MKTDDKVENTKAEDIGAYCVVCGLGTDRRCQFNPELMLCQPCSSHVVGKAELKAIRRMIQPKKGCAADWKYGYKTAIMLDGYDCYHERNRSLELLGYDDWKSYIKSQVWRAIRCAFLAVKPCCVACGFKACVVRLVDYRVETLQGKRLDSLVSLCRVCDKKFSFYATGDPVQTSVVNVSVVDALRGKPETSEAASAIEAVLMANRILWQQDALTALRDGAKQRDNSKQRRLNRLRNRWKQGEARKMDHKKRCEVRAGLAKTVQQQAVIMALPKLPYLD